MSVLFALVLLGPWFRVVVLGFEEVDVVGVLSLVSLFYLCVFVSEIVHRPFMLGEGVRVAGMLVHFLHIVDLMLSIFCHLVVFI